MDKRKVMLVFGTRPEAIKMCPLYLELERRENIETIVCVTGQHTDMVYHVLDFFGVKAKYDLKIMKARQTLFDINIKILSGMKEVLDKEKPDLVLVHGDTSTSYTAALSCYYLQIDVGHVEAGLRTYDIYSPFPEEFNRQAISLISKYNFAPTDKAKQNLIDEGKDENSIYVTGNTSIDALKYTVKADYKHEVLDAIDKDKRVIVLTCHRRENFGQPMMNVFEAVNRIAHEFSDVEVIFPAHPNPIVQMAARSVLGKNEHVKIIEPMDVFDFHNLISRAYFVLTDSGGIQEEAPSLGKPVLVLRNTTERPEGVEAGSLKVVGTDEQNVYNESKRLLIDSKAYEAMSIAKNPYGDGTASKQIADVIVKD